MRAILPLLSLSTVAQALYLFIDGTAPKCFYEELPKDTLVVGHYSAEEWDDNSRSWSRHDGISIYISVDVRLFLSVSSPFRPTNPIHPTVALSCQPCTNMLFPNNRKSSTTTTAWCRSGAQHPAASPSRHTRPAITASASHRAATAGARTG